MSTGVKRALLVAAAVLVAVGLVLGIFFYIELRGLRQDLMHLRGHGHVPPEDQEDFLRLTLHDRLSLAQSLEREAITEAKMHVAHDYFLKDDFASAFRLAIDTHQTSPLHSVHDRFFTLYAGVRSGRSPREVMDRLGGPSPCPAFAAGLIAYHAARSGEPIGEPATTLSEPGDEACEIWVYFLEFLTHLEAGQVERAWEIGGTRPWDKIAALRRDDDTTGYVVASHIIATLTIEASEVGEDAVAQTLARLWLRANIGEGDSTAATRAKMKEIAGIP